MLQKTVPLPFFRPVGRRVQSSGNPIAQIYSALKQRTCFSEGNQKKLVVATRCFTDALIRIMERWAGDFFGVPEFARGNSSDYCRAEFMLLFADADFLSYYRRACLAGRRPCSVTIFVRGAERLIQPSATFFHGRSRHVLERAQQ
jgi:hypothetical protein